MNWAWLKYGWISLVGIVACLSVSAQTINDLGTPLIRNYLREETGGHNQNWGTVQDQRGVLYFANTDGILSYDGVHWRHIQTPTGLVFSIDIGPDNTVYFGTRQDLGFLSPDSTGALQYASLRSMLEDRYSDLGDIRRIFSAKDGVYFVSQKFIFRWNGEEMKVWEAGDQPFHLSFYINGTFYVRQFGVGLLNLQDGELELVPNGADFAEKRIYAMFPYSDEQLLIGTMYDGLYLYDGQSFEKFSTEADDFLASGRLYGGLELPNEEYAFITLNKGMVVMDRSGRVKYVLNRSTGLQTDEIHGGYIDRDGALWLTLQKGIARVDVSTPLSAFYENSGLTGYVTVIKKFKGQLYAGTSTGLYRLEKDSAVPFQTQFKQLSEESTWAFQEHRDQLMVGTDDRVYQLDGDKMITISERTSIRSMYINPQFPDLLLIGSQGGLFQMEFVNGRWIDRGIVKGIDGEIRHILRQDSLLWLGSFHLGIYRVALDEGTLIRPQQINRYDTLHGLPSMVENMVFPYKDDKVFLTHRGIYQLDYDEQRFRLDPKLGKILADSSRAIYQFDEGTDGRVWMHLRNREEEHRETGYVEMDASGRPQWITEDFKTLQNTGFYEVYAAEDGITWLGGVDFMMRYDPSRKQPVSGQFSTLIRRISVGEDSIIYGGDRKSEIPEIIYSNNNARFQYSAVTFSNAEESEYQYYLEGFDEGWSDWTRETQKDYTNLPEGNYIFRIRGKSISGKIGEEDQYSFTVLPPWYRSWWAYVSYTLLGLLCLQFLVGWRSRTLKAEKMALEETIKQRTAEIATKNEQLEEQAVKLREMDKIKSNFFANISHEFRTPLTLILGPLNDQESNNDPAFSSKQLDTMRYNANRLLRLINQLLDLSKLEGGNLKLQLAERDIVPFVKGLTMSFESLALTYGIDLQVGVREEGMPLYFDADKLEKALTNLIANALKFTEKGGLVKVVLAESSGDTVNISVEDNGSGISPDQLPRVFDRFYQADSSSTRLREGSGIGLALTKELVELHHGTIEVKSDIGVGTHFIITLKKGKAHFAKEEYEEVTDHEISFTPQQTASNVPNGETSEYTEEQDLVLIVEDNHDVRSYVRSHLENQFNLIEADNGQEGLEVALEKVPDLIVSDVMMPLMDGYELTEKLKNDIKTSHIPVVLLTAKADSEDKLEGLGTGADDYLTKPFDGKELVLRISNLIKTRQALRERFTKEVMLEPAAITAPSMEEKFINQLMGLVEEHLSDAELSVEKLSELMAMSRIHLHRKLKALTGQSASQFIRSIRLKRAKQLLEQKSATVTEIAYEVGFNNVSYFAKCFKEQFGMLPSELELKL